MAYPDDKETFRRVVNQELPEIPGDVVDKDDHNLPADFLERLQDTLGYGIKMGYATVKAFFDYVVSQIALIANKADKTGDTFSGDVRLDKGENLSPRLYLSNTGKPNLHYIYSQGANFYFWTRDGLIIQSSVTGVIAEFGIADEITFRQTMRLFNNDIIAAGNITLSSSRDFINPGTGRGIIVKTPDGTKSFRISVDNAGAVITTQV